MAKAISYYEGIDRLYGKEMANAVEELLASWDGNIPTQQEFIEQVRKRAPWLLKQAQAGAAFYLLFNTGGLNDQEAISQSVAFLQGFLAGARYGALCAAVREGSIQ